MIDIEEPSDVIPLEAIYRLQVAMAQLPQVELPTEHFFADGMYCRMLFIPAGVQLVGKIHKREHFFIICHGTIAVTTDTGVKKITGPAVLKASAGTKRAGWALTDVTCLNIHKTDNTELDALEAELIEPEDLKLFDSRNKLIRRTP